MGPPQSWKSSGDSSASLQPSHACFPFRATPESRLLLHHGATAYSEWNPLTRGRLLRRTADTETQTAFDRRTRMKNLKNAFALAPRADLNPILHYILIDDVFTTGSTLNRCAHTLRRAGALNVDVVTLGHG